MLPQQTKDIDSECYMDVGDVLVSYLQQVTSTFR